jgi:hypothetical protein
MILWVRPRIVVQKTRELLRVTRTPTLDLCITYYKNDIIDCFASSANNLTRVYVLKFFGAKTRTACRFGLLSILVFRPEVSFMLWIVATGR